MSPGCLSFYCEGLLILILSFWNIQKFRKKNCDWTNVKNTIRLLSKMMQTNCRIIRLGSTGFLPYWVIKRLTIIYIIFFFRISNNSQLKLFRRQFEIFFLFLIEIHFKQLQGHYMKKAILWKVHLHNISKYLRSPVFSKVTQQSLLFYLRLTDLWPLARDGRVKNKKKQNHVK